MTVLCLWLSFVLLGVPAAAKAVESHYTEAHVPGIGSVKASIEIRLGIQPRVVFLSEHGSRLLEFSLGEAGTSDPRDSLRPRGQILLRTIQGLPSPLFAIDVRNYGATGYRDYLALVGAIDGKLSLLHAPWKAHNLGGIHLGAISPSIPAGVVQWNFQWADCHACSNPYEFQTFPWNAQAKSFVDRPESVKLTEKKYAGPQDALRELHPNYSNILEEFNLLYE